MIDDLHEVNRELGITPRPFLVPPEGKMNPTHLRRGDETERTACKLKVHPAFFTPSEHPRGRLCARCLRLLRRLLEQ